MSPKGIKRTLICTAVCLMSTASGIIAETPRQNPLQVVIHADHYSPSECLHMAGMERRAQVDPEALSDLVESLFEAIARDGYPTARLDSVVHRGDEGAETVELFISEGDPVVVGESSISGFDELEAANLPPGARLTGTLLTERSEEILNHLTDSGFPFAQVTVIPHRITAGDGALSARLQLRVEPGPFERIGAVRFPGARLTRPGLLTLESHLVRGDRFSRSGLRRAHERLERLPFIDRAGPPRLRQTGPGLVTVEIPVMERRVNSISGVVSAAPGQDTPTGELQLEFGNILGTGRRLQFAWLGLNPDRRGIRAGYREPWLFGRPWHATLELEQWSEDTLGTTTRRKFGVEWEPMDRTVISGSAADERIGRDGEAASGSRAVWLEAGLTLDRLNHPWNPTRGYLARVASAAGSRKWDAPGRKTSHLRRETGSLQAARIIARSWVMFGRFEARDIAGSGVVAEELVRVGGIGSVRGFAEERMLARGAGWGTVELRWRPDASGFLGCFSDLGYIYRTDRRAEPDERYPASVGVTAGLLTRAGRLGLDLALAADEPPSRARLHVRLEGWF